MKNELKINTEDLQMKELQVKTIPSYEVAEMMEREHAKVLKMLEGETYKDGRTKVVGIIPTLTKARTRVSDFFIESTYKDASGKQNKCYECTKMGCELLGNKMTGEKGILFTARYVAKFNAMEQVIQQLDKKQKLQLAILNGDDTQRILALKEYENILTKPLLDKIEEDKPLVEFAETISKASDSIDIGTFSKLVKDQDIKIGRNKLFEWLRDNGYLMKNNVPYQKYIDNNYFEIVEYTYKTSYGEKLTTKTLITGLGQIKIIEKLRKELNN